MATQAAKRESINTSSYKKHTDWTEPSGRSWARERLYFIRCWYSFFPIDQHAWF